MLLLLGMLSGCVSPQSRAGKKDVHGPLPPPPSESLRSELGRVWVSSSLAEPNVQFVITPAAGAWAGFGRGAGAGAEIGCKVLGWPALSGDLGGVVIGAIGCIGGATLGAISGGIYGAIAAEPEKSVQTVVASVRNALASAQTQQRMRDQVRELATRRTTALSATEEDVAAIRLETAVSSIQLDGLHPQAYGRGSVGMINPSVRLVVTAEARLIRSSNKEELYAARFQYWGPRMTVPEWASHQAQPVREEIDRATATLAEQIVDAIFFLYRAP
ncbi:MAG: hypothetical protein CV089_24060 [Nitrospira sp. WS110]|nr:hypothetical protein [Nitrospira sp. WS110]